MYRVMLQFSSIDVVAEKNPNLLNYFDLFDSPCLISLCGRSDETAEREAEKDVGASKLRDAQPAFLLPLPIFGALSFCIL